MKITPTAIPDVRIIEPLRISDHRGFFSEVFSERALADAGITPRFVQDNHAFSAAPGVLRGLHYQLPPHAQAKLVRVTRGRILDVALDIRRSSPTFARHVAVELSAVNWKQLFIPTGFAHGYLTLEPDCEVLYKVSAQYSPSHDRGILWDDPALAIPWPAPPGGVVLSPRDKALPHLSQAADLFD